MISTLAAPRYWPTWVGVGVMWLVAQLPLRAQFALGHAIGAIGYRFARARRHIATVNIELCFPELGESERDALVRRIFASTGIGAVETAIAWFGDISRLRDRVTFEGLDV